jgi:polynucleotide 5'-hydroxyl-kinase GRC3/NOL9
MLIGAPDTGKSTLAREILRQSVAKGRVAALVDADVAQSTVGPPGCVGLRWVRTSDDLSDISRADALRFVGSTNPSRLVLQMVLATAALVEQARATADLVLIDTTGAVSGVVGQTLKYHKVETCRPELVVALQRGAELEPVIGMLQRFFSVDVITADVHPELIPLSPDIRSERRVRQLKQALADPLEAWRIRPTVFAPTLPTGLDLDRLAGMVVGVQDGVGACLGLGVLDYTDGVLRVLTNHGEGMQGLRLGSMRIDLNSFETKPVNLRELMFGLAL